MWQALDSLAKTLVSSPITVTIIILLSAITMTLIWAIVKLVSTNIETQKLHNETEERRNKEKDKDVERVRELEEKFLKQQELNLEQNKINSTQQKTLEDAIDKAASASAAAGGAVSEARRLQDSYDRVMHELKITKDALDALTRAHEAYKHETAIRIAEYEERQKVQTERTDADQKAIAELKKELTASLDANNRLLALLRVKEGDEAKWEERFDQQRTEIQSQRTEIQKQNDELVALRNKVAELETGIKDRETARDTARVERDNAVKKMAEQEKKMVEQAVTITDLTKRVTVIEKTGMTGLLSPLAGSDA